MNIPNKYLLIIISLIILPFASLPISGGYVTAQTSAQFPASLVAYWPADGDALDIVGSNNGTLLNGTTFAPGKVGQAFSLDGVDDVIDLGQNNIIGTGNTPFSVAMWMYPTRIPNGLYYFTIRLKQDAQFFIVFTQDFFGASGGLVGAVFRAQAHQWYTPIDHASLMNQWTHVVVVYNGGDKSSASSFETYLNGERTPTPSVDLGGVGGDCNDNALGSDTGGNCTGNFAFFKGLIDEVQIYNRVLSSTEVEVIYNTGNTNQPPTAEFTWLPQSPTEGAPVQFTDLSTSGSGMIQSWHWDFAGLGTSSNQHPSFTFADNGLYNVCLTVTDAPGSGTPAATIIEFERNAPFPGADNTPWPRGDVTLGGVPFRIPQTDPSVWKSEDPFVTGPNPRTLDILVNQQAVDHVYTLINTGGGAPGPTAYAWLEFWGDGGAYVRKDLVGDVDIRDYNYDGWTNTINGTTTVNVFLHNPGVYNGERRLDMQIIDLPDAFLTQTLTHIRLSDNGGINLQRTILEGVTVQTQALTTGNTDTVCHMVDVGNVAPMVDAGPAQTVYRHDVVTLSGMWTDPAGNLDNPYTWSWDLNGDTIPDRNGAAPYGTAIVETTSFAQEGNYMLSFAVIDKDGSPGSDTLTVEVLNHPPTCATARASIGALWPPNHKFVPIDILDVVDPEGDPVVIQVSSIFQDEPVDVSGSGNTSPDGQGVGTATAQVRAERMGSGNGRVYHIRFSADDGQGGACSGEVLVGVPHNNQDTPIDDGPLYDSTISVAGASNADQNAESDNTLTEEIYLPLVRR